MKTDVIICGLLIFFIPIIAIVGVIGNRVTNAPIYKCVAQAIEAKISADDIQKICYNRK